MVTCVFVENLSVMISGLPDELYAKIGFIPTWRGFALPVLFRPGYCQEVNVLPFHNKLV